MLHSHYFLPLSFLFSDLLLHSFLLLHLLLLILSLNDCDSLVKLSEQMGQLGVNFIHQIWEISAGFVVDSLKEHHWGKVFFEILKLFRWQLSLKNVHDVFFLSRFDLFSKTNHIFLQVDDSIHISPQGLHPLRVEFHDLCTDQLDFEIGSIGYFINEIPDG